MLCQAFQVPEHPGALNNNYNNNNNSKSNNNNNTTNTGPKALKPAGNLTPESC